MLVTNRTNIRYFSGFSGTTGYLVLENKKGFLFTDARYHLVAKAVLPKHFRVIDITGGVEKPWKDFIKAKHVRRMGFESQSMTVSLFRFFKRSSKGVDFVDVKAALDERRMVKRKEELVKLAVAQRITDRILSELKLWLRVGVSEQAIAWKIECLAREFGAEDISFPPIVGINEHSASPHHQNSLRKLRRGDLVLIDMGVIFEGYCSDMTRMIFTKTPTAEQRAVYELVRKAQETARGGVKAGVTGVRADALAREVIGKAGYGKYFGHSLGHGVGLDIHELPNLSSKYSKPLPEGSVVTIEPGVYLPGKFGVRLEDMVVVQKHGVRTITKSSNAIQDSVIRLQ